MKLLMLPFALVFILMASTVQAEVKTKEQIVGEAKSKAAHITVNELKKKMESGEKFLLVDTRTEKEYETAHIQNAAWIPRGTLEFDIQKITRDPKAEIIIYCRSGARGSLAMLDLKDIGYENVRDLDGGFKQWVTTGNSVFNMHGEIQVINYGKEE